MNPDLSFQPAWWCRNPHLQTLWPRITGYRPAPPLRLERLELADGDFLDLHWSAGDSGPIVLIIHGLEGSYRSPYAQGLLRAVHQRGWRGVVFNLRGCSDEPNRLARAYHTGETQDLAYILNHLNSKEPSTPIVAVGYSAGGNILLKRCAEDNQIPIRSAVAVSVPFDLSSAVRTLEKSLFGVYEKYFMHSLKAKARQKVVHHDFPLTLTEISRLKTIWEFDERVTAPLFGFEGAEDYYRKSSCIGYLNDIRTETLILHALDDPFMTPDVIPKAEMLPGNINLELMPHGGHVGFLSGTKPSAPIYWLEQRICAHCQNHFE